MHESKITRKSNKPSPDISETHERS